MAARRSAVIIAPREPARDTLAPITCIFAIIGIKTPHCNLKRFSTVGTASSPITELELLFPTNSELREKSPLGSETAREICFGANLTPVKPRDSAIASRMGPSVLYRGRHDLATLRGRFTAVDLPRHRCYRNRNVALYRARVTSRRFAVI